MIQLIAWAFVFLSAPSGLVLAYYLRKYLAHRMRVLEDRRIREELREHLD